MYVKKVTSSVSENIQHNFISVHCELLYKLYQHQQMYSSIHYVFYSQYASTLFGATDILYILTTLV